MAQQLLINVCEINFVGNGGLTRSINNASDEQEISSYGINLAMVYLKIHDRDNARKVLLDVKSKCVGNPYIMGHCDKLLEKIQ